MASSAIAQPPKQRVRAFHHKNRSGCAGCKRRRIRCDERRPGCARCQQSSLRCSYDPPKAWIFELPTLASTTSRSEHDLLTYSYRHGMKFMTLYVRSSQQFFGMYAPQISHVHPAAKHALIAISARYQAHLSHVDPEQSPDVAAKFTTDALLHYNKGLKTLAQMKQDSLPLEVLVTCSLLFAAVELWPQKDMAPHVHILHGLRIAQSIEATSVHSETLLGYMLTILLYLAENVASYNDNFNEQTMGITDAYLDRSWLIPTIFDDPVEATEQVDKLIKRVSRLDVMSEGDNHYRRRRLWEAYGRLSVAITDTMKSKSTESITCHDLRSLLVHLRLACVMLKTNMVSDEMIFDACSKDFKYILTESEQLLAYELKSDSERGPASVRASLGLLSPLFLVATKCRNSVSRRRALELLHGSRRRERCWNSCLATMLAETVIDAEERCLTRDSGLALCFPSAEQRICLSDVKLDRESCLTTIRYSRPPYGAGAPFEQVVRPWIPNINDNYEVVTLSNKSLRAYGNTGTILVSPSISCQCGSR